jgi:Flp pilus assembly protein TadD
MTRYHTYAQEQLGSVAPGEPVASWALFGLGKLYTVLAQQTSPVAAAEAKAMVFHQAALTTCPEHALAANELAVLWARTGRYDMACALLEAAAQGAPCREIWQNLAVIQARLGRSDSARLAAERASQMAQSTEAQWSGLGAVDWVSPEAFSRASRPPAELQSPEKHAAGSKAEAAAAPAWRGWGRAWGESRTR